MAEAERPSTALMRMIRGFQISQAIHVAAKLGVADALRDGPRSSDDLAQSVSAEPQALYRLQRALSAVGVFEERPGRSFAHTPLSECLLSDADDRTRDWALLIGEEYFWGTWAHLLLGVQTGETVFPQLRGESVWEYRGKHPETNAVFNRAMTAGSLMASRQVLQVYDFSPFTTVVDVGGGRGALLAGILSAHPHLRGVLFDQPHVVSDEDLKAAGVADRCEVVSGSFFDAVPAGGDAYVLKSIIHDWADEESVQILANCRKAIADGGKLLLIEQVVVGPNEGPRTKFSDLNMLVLPGGLERTEEEFAALFSASGFRLTRIVVTGPDQVCVIEGEPV